jgi:hypothetical protein
MPSNEFSAPYDATAKLATAALCVLVPVVSILSRIPLALAAMLLVIVLCYAWAPRGYLLRDGEIVIRRLVGEVRIPLSEVRELRAVTPDDLRGCIRLWGSGGAFGYFGNFRTSRFGNCTWYVTDRSKALVVVTSDRTILLSPADTAAFLEAARAGAPQISASASPQERRSSRPSISLAIGLVAVALVLAVVAAALLYAPGPPKCTLTADSLVIHDLFYGVTLHASDVDAASVRVIDPAQQPEWRTTLRTNGFSNSKYQSGWFRVQGGSTVRLYRAAGEIRLVLLPPRGSAAPVLLGANDPDALALRIRGAWARAVTAR